MTNRIETPLFKELKNIFFCIEMKDSFIYLYRVSSKGVKEKEPLFKMPDGNKATLIIEVK